MSQAILDFIKINYFVIMYGITWLISVFTYKKYFDTILKYLPILIAYTFFNEFLGYLIAYNDNFQLIFEQQYAKHRIIIYNIYSLIFFLYFFYIFWKTIPKKKEKNIIKFGGFIFILINIINVFIQNPLIETFAYPYIFGVVLLIYSTLTYFKLVFKNYTFDLLKYSLLFWVSLGLLIFYIIYLPLKIFREFNYELYTPFRQLHLLMIVVMYTLFCIGFIVSKRKAFR